MGINTNEKSSDIATLIYISVILYGASIYKHAASVAILQLFVILSVNLYMLIPEASAITNINIFKQFSNVKLNILNINGKYAVNGL